MSFSNQSNTENQTPDLFSTPSRKKSVSMLQGYDGASFTFSPGRTRSTRRRAKGVPLPKDLHLAQVEERLNLSKEVPITPTQVQEMRGENEVLASKISQMALDLEKQRQAVLALERDCESKDRDLKTSENESTLLKKENSILNQRIKLLTGRSEEINSMPLKDLRKVYKQLQDGMYEMKKAMEQRTTTSHICIACQERERNIVLLPCKHLCLCSACSPAVRDKCPLCRTEIQEHLKIFS